MRCSRRAAGSASISRRVVMPGTSTPDGYNAHQFVEAGALGTDLFSVRSLSVLVEWRAETVVVDIGLISRGIARCGRGV